MKIVYLGLSLAAMAVAGAAYAQNSAPAMRHGADGDRTTTRVEMQANAARMFGAMDVNRDGKLDPADREVRHAARFDRMDTNKDGQISRAEFDAPRPAAAGMERGGMEHRGMMRHGKGHGRMGMMMLRMADANKDGAVSQAEFTDGMLKHFDQVDANKDGQLTPQERQAAHAAMRQHRQGKMGGDHKGGHHGGHHGGHQAPPASPGQ